MNDYNHEILRKRHRNLIIVEGEKEENKLFQIIFQTFPEIDVSIDDILIYGTNIYVLYNDIIKEYGEMWFEEDVDLPFIVGKKKGYSKTLNVKDFSNVYLVFDYERHDPNFCEKKLSKCKDIFMILQIWVSYTLTIQCLNLINIFLTYLILIMRT